MKRGCIVLAILTAMWWIAGVLVDIFQCSPVSKAFNPAMTPEGCIDQNAYCMGSKQIPYPFSVLSEISLCHLWFDPQAPSQTASLGDRIVITLRPTPEHTHTKLIPQDFDLYFDS